MLPCKAVKAAAPYLMQSGQMVMGHTVLCTGVSRQTEAYASAILTCCTSAAGNNIKMSGQVCYGA